MAADENSWRTPAFRQSVVQKIEEAIRSSGMPTTKNSVEMEKHVFQKAKTREEYLGFVARLILHVREMNSKKASGMNPGGGTGQNMQDPINALQTLARQGTGNQLMGLVPPQSQPQVTATNLLQTLNQRPILQQKLQPGSVPMGPMSGQMAGPMGQMNNPMGGPMGGPIGGPMVSQMGGPLGGPMGGQMSGQMGGPMGAMGGPLGGPMPNQMGGPMGSPISGQMGGPMGGQMTHMQQRKVPGNEGGMMLGGQGPAYVGPRSVAPNTFLRQSPTPPHSAQSPASAAGLSSNQMVASPALVPSPNAQMTPSMGGSMRSVGMAPSPSSSLNTPGQAVPTPSPCSIQEDQAYREKARQLSKYIEPLRRMIAKMGNDDVEKLSKMTKLLDILSNPNKRMPLETLLKCEVVLEKLDFKRSETGPTAPSALREQHPLLEALSNHLQSPLINHTLQRTFGPCLDALFGSDIKMLPSLVKKKKLEEPPDDIPEVLQGEIARLDQRFKVSLDPTQQVGSRSVQLLCWLDDRHLPCVPPVSLSVPEDYPSSPPRCHLSPHEYSATRFLVAVQSALESRVRKLPGRFSVSQLLDTWEMSVRQACAPIQSPVSAATVLMGI